MIFLPKTYIIKYESELRVPKTEAAIHQED